MAVPFCSLPASCGGGDERPELALFVSMRGGGEGRGGREEEGDTGGGEAASREQEPKTTGKGKWPFFKREKFQFFLGNEM